MWESGFTYDMLLRISGWEAAESLGYETSFTYMTSTANSSHFKSAMFILLALQYLPWQSPMSIIMKVNKIGGEAEAFMKLYTPCCIDSTAVSLPCTLAFWTQCLSLAVLNVATTGDQKLMLGSKGLATRLPCPMILALTLSIAVLTWLLQEINTGVRKLLPYLAWSPPLTAISVHGYDCHVDGVQILYQWSALRSG